MKNRNFVIVLVVLLLVIVFGAGAYFLSQNKQVATKTESENVKPTSSSNSAASTLKELLASKTPSKCTYSTNAGTTKISGTVYVSGGKVRGDFTTTSDKTQITGHMATDEKYVYTWTDGAKQGYKFEMDAKAQADAAANANSQKPDFNQKFNYSCSPWVVDNKIMMIPSDIVFTTFTMPSVKTTSPSGGTINNQSACQACAGLPEGQSKTMCLTQLHCN